MATCKDCLQFADCLNEQSQTRYYSLNVAYNDVGSKCEFFKDKSRFIELPCKVGDTIYHTFTGKVDYFEVYDIQVHNDGIYVTYDFNRYFNADEFGKTVFLTREEAEKKLEE